MVQKWAIFIISSWEATVRKDADVKEHDEGIASAIAEERSLRDALCSRSFPDEIVKIGHGSNMGSSQKVTSEKAEIANFATKQ